VVLPQDLLLEVVLVHLPVTGRGKQKAEKSAVLYFSNMWLALEHERKRHVNNM